MNVNDGETGAWIENPCKLLARNYHLYNIHINFLLSNEHIIIIVLYINNRYIYKLA